MLTETDAELLRRYTAEKSEAAFAELVRRRVNLVYSVALRQCGGDASLAEDVTQKVFADLARKAAELSRRVVLTGWLYRSAQFAASDVVRAERRRRGREEEAQTMQIMMNDAGAPADWERVRPVLDETMGELSEADRDAVALRFFEERSFAEIGRALALSEEAARKRVDRAVDKLHALLAKRGVNSTTAALAVALANQAGVAAPAGLAASVAGAAIAAATVGFTVATKLTLAFVVTLLVAGASIFVIQRETNKALDADLTSLRARSADLARLRDENQRLKREAAEVASLRGDDAELARLQGEVMDLQVKLHEVAQKTEAVVQNATVTGMVKRPGTLMMPTAGEIITLRELIDRAGGLTVNAKGSGIRVSRTLKDGSAKIYTLDYAGDATRFKIEPDDIIYVPEGIPSDLIMQALRQ